jgi:hypothetical protein
MLTQRHVYPSFHAAGYPGVRLGRELVSHGLPNLILITRYLLFCLPVTLHVIGVDITSHSRTPTTSSPPPHNLHLPGTVVSTVYSCHITAYIGVDITSHSRTPTSSSPPAPPWYGSIHGVQSRCSPDGRCPTSFPNPNTLGATFNRTVWRGMGAVIGVELRSIWLQGIGENHPSNLPHMGLDCWSPNVGIQRDVSLSSAARAGFEPRGQADCVLSPHSSAHTDVHVPPSFFFFFFSSHPHSMDMDCTVSHCIVTSLGGAETWRHHRRIHISAVSLVQNIRSGSRMARTLDTCRAWRLSNTSTLIHSKAIGIQMGLLVDH